MPTPIGPMTPEQLAEQIIPGPLTLLPEDADDLRKEIASAIHFSVGAALEGQRRLAEAEERARCARIVREGGARVDWSAEQDRSPSRAFARCQVIVPRSCVWTTSAGGARSRRTAVSMAVVPSTSRSPAEGAAELLPEGRGRGEAQRRTNLFRAV